MVDSREQHYRKLLDIGLALSTERNSVRLMEKILDEAKSMCNADGGTLYRMVDNDQRLRFEIMRNDSLGIYNGGTSGKEINLPPVELLILRRGKKTIKMSPPIAPYPKKRSVLMMPMFSRILIFKAPKILTKPPAIAPNRF